MDPAAVELLVHVSAPCGFSDDTRYRAQAHNLLAFLEKSECSPVRETVDRTQSAEQKIQSVLADVNSHSDAQGSPTDDQLLASAATSEANNSSCPSQERSSARLSSCSDPGGRTYHLNTVQVGCTPTVSAARTPGHARGTAPAPVLETPLLLHEIPTSDTPSSTEPDSQAPYTSFKRAFAGATADKAHEAKSSPSKRRCTSPASKHPHSRYSRSSTCAEPLPSARTTATSNESCSRLPDVSSPSRKHGQHVHKPTRRHRPYETNDTHGPTTRTPASASNMHKHPTAAHSHRAMSPITPPARKPPRPPTQRPSLQPSAVIPSHTPSETLLSTISSRSAAALLLVDAPRPPTSNQRFTTHLTPALAHVRARLQPLPKYYKPRAQHRAVRPLERGYWRIAFPPDDDAAAAAADAAARRTTWARLCAHVAGGRAGPGTRLERALDGQYVGASQGRAGAVVDAEKGGWEVWKVWCWGEVLVEVYLLLVVDSGGRVRGWGAAWWDGADECVVVV